MRFSSQRQFLNSCLQFFASPAILPIQVILPIPAILPIQVILSVPTILPIQVISSVPRNIRISNFFFHILKFMKKFMRKWMISNLMKIPCLKITFELIRQMSSIWQISTFHTICKQCGKYTNLQVKWACSKIELYFTPCIRAQSSLNSHTCMCNLF